MLTRTSQWLQRAWRAVALTHHWLGILLCGFFAMWFVTGSVQVFVPFPAMPAAAAARALQPVALAQVRCAPGRAVAAVGMAVTDLRLRSVDGKARYLATLPDGSRLSLDAADCRPNAPIDAAGARRIVSRLTTTAIASVDGPWIYDQWTVHDKYVSERPYFRVRLADADRTDYYVSARTGLVAQRTTRTQRAWNRVGAVVHWLNVPALRIHPPAWRRLTWTVALAGLVLLVLGLVLGLRATWRQRRMGSGGLSPYRGLLGLHHRLGLLCALLVLSWLASGWLSLDQGRIFSPRSPDARQVAALRGLSTATAAARWRLDDLQQLPPLRELRFAAFDGQAQLQWITAAIPPASRLRLATDSSPDGRATLSVPELRAALERAFAPQRVVALVPLDERDPYALRNEPWPAGAWRAVLSDDAATWVHIQDTTGEILSVWDRSGRAYRIWVDGLHRFDLPVNVGLGAAWQVAVLACTTAGFGFSVLGMLLALRRVRRAWRAGH